MLKHQVRTTADALAYITDCTLATVSHMAMLKSRKKSEYERQIGIAETGIRWMKEMGVQLKGTRAEDVVRCGSVAAWAAEYEPVTPNAEDQRRRSRPLHPVVGRSPETKP